MNRKPNFYLKYKQAGQVKARAKRNKMFLKLSPFAFLVIVLIVATIYIKIEVNEKREILNEYNSYVNNPKNIADYNAGISLENENSVLRTAFTNAENVLATIISYPRPNSTVKTHLEKIGIFNNLTISIISYNSLTGLLTFDAISENPESINAFIKNVNESGLFFNAKYTGYSILPMNGGYKVDLTCFLNESAGE